MEDKQGVYASSVLAGILVVLSLVLLPTVGQYGLVGDLMQLSDEQSEESSAGSSSGGGASDGGRLPSDSAEGLSAGSARAATTAYVEALNYEGSNGDEYLSQVNRTVWADTFYNSDTDTGDRGGIGYGGNEVQSIAQGLNDYEGNLREEVELRDFEVENKTRDAATVTAKYEGRSYEDDNFTYSAVNRQTMELVEREDEWRVARVTKVRNLQSSAPE